MALSHGIAVLLGATLLAQCASSGGDRSGLPAATAIAYRQSNPAMHQALISAAAVDPGEFYSDPHADRLAKVVSEENIAELTDRLRDVGFFDYATRGAAAESPFELRMRIDGADWVWAKDGTMDTAELQAYHAALSLVLNTYNQVQAFHVGRGDETLMREHERLETRRREFLERERRDR